FLEGPAPGGGSPRFWRFQGRGVPPGGWVPGGGGGTFGGPGPGAPPPPAAISQDTVDLIVALRKALAGRGLDAGPDTICWHLEHHHQIRVSAATVSRYLTRHGLVTPEPRKRPKSSYLRFQAELPNECWQYDFTHYPLADGDDAEV